MIFDNIIKKAGANNLNKDYLELQDLLFHQELKILKDKYINKLKLKVEKVNNDNVINFNELKKENENVFKRIKK